MPSHGSSYSQRSSNTGGHTHKSSGGGSKYSAIDEFARNKDNRDAFFIGEKNGGYSSAKRNVRKFDVEWEKASRRK